MKKQPKISVVITNKAKAKMLKHVDFLAKVNPAAAQKLHNDLLEAAKSLSEMPERCQYFNVKGLPPRTYRRLVLQKRYLLVFEIMEDKVAILDIIDGRQDNS